MVYVKNARVEDGETFWPVNRAYSSGACHLGAFFCLIQLIYDSLCPLLFSSHSIEPISVDFGRSNVLVLSE